MVNTSHMSVVDIRAKLAQGQNVRTRQWHARAYHAAKPKFFGATSTKSDEVAPLNYATSILLTRCGIVEVVLLEQVCGDKNPQSAIPSAM
jgi:hypothetical protein